MNNLTKSIASLLILNPVIAFSATENSNLTSYLKDYHPKIYAAAQQNGVDLNALEFTEPNINNIEKASLEDVTLKKHPGWARKYCEKSKGIFLENNFVATCVTQDGTFGNGRELLGMTFNPAGSGTITSPDYLRPGSPHEYFSVKFNQTLFTNNNSGANHIPTKVKALNRSASQEGGALVESTITQNRSTELKIIQKYTIDPNSKEIIVRVEMKNTGRTTLEGVTYARGLDPDQSRPSTFKTHNKRGHTYYSAGVPVNIAPNNIAWASGIKGLSVALYSVDPVNHNTCISSTWTTDPVQILNQNCGTISPPSFLPWFNYSDSTINIAFKIGDLKPQETRVFSFKYLFNQEKVSINPPIIIDPPVGIDPPIIIDPIKPPILLKE